MRKTLSLILVLVLCLSLCACGESAEEKLTAEIAGGTYATGEKYNSGGGIYGGKQSFLEFYKGGVGKGYTVLISLTQNTRKETDAYSFTWRIEDEYVIITTASGYERIFSIGVNGGTVTEIANNTLYNRQPKNN